jgi:diguanylate cyclase (GGDEF)-like protein
VQIMDDVKFSGGFEQNDHWAQWRNASLIEDDSLPATLPTSEAERLAALRSYDVLDTAFETNFDNIVQLAAQMTGCPIALVSLIDAKRQWFKARFGLDVAETPREQAFCAHAIQRPGEALVVPDATRDPRFADNPLVTGAPDIRFYAGVPLVNPEGAALGTLCVIDRKPREMTAEQRKALAQLAATAMTTLELRRAMNRLRGLALIDALTGLPNRAALIDTIDRTISRQRRSREPFALIYLDLDGFKCVNDRHGHAAGDSVLRVVAAILARELRHEDVVGRIGGDEVAMVLAGSRLEGEAAVERVRAEVEVGMQLHGWPVTASVGAVSFAAPPGSVDAALAAADMEMYRAKTMGKNRVSHRTYEQD